MDAVRAGLARAAAASRLAESGRTRGVKLTVRGTGTVFYALDPTDQERRWAPRLGTIYPGDCYEQAVLFLGDNFHDLPPQTYLAHGVLWRTGIGHGWVELPGAVIFDGYCQQYFDLREYYRALDIELERRYTARDALQQVIETVNYGPWHETKGAGRKASP